MPFLGFTWMILRILSRKPLKMNHILVLSMVLLQILFHKKRSLKVSISKQIIYLHLAIGETYNSFTIPVPKISLKLMLGERAILLTEGNFIIPKKLEDLGYKWKYDELVPTLRALQ